MPEQWVLSVDGSSNLKGSGARIVLEGPGEMILEQTLCFNFQASNNQAEYKVVISGLKLAREVGVSHLLVPNDLQLIASQIIGYYQIKDALLFKYLQ